MLLNLSNHPLAKWSAEQREAAQRQFGRVQDVLFPAVDPTASLAAVEQVVDDRVQSCLDLFSAEPDTQSNAVHIMGEYTFTYLFVKEMAKRNVLCVASTTERIVTENADGSKTTVFKFVQFRPYSTLTATTNREPATRDHT